MQSRTNSVGAAATADSHTSKSAHFRKSSSKLCKPHSLILEVALCAGLQDCCTLCYLFSSRSPLIGPGKAFDTLHSHRNQSRTDTTDFNHLLFGSAPFRWKQRTDKQKQDHAGPGFILTNKRNVIHLSKNRVNIHIFIFISTCSPLNVSPRSRIKTLNCKRF